MTLIEQIQAIREERDRLKDELASLRARVKDCTLTEASEVKRDLPR